MAVPDTRALRDVSSLMQVLTADDVTAAHGLIQGVEWPLTLSFVDALKRSSSSHYFVMTAPPDLLHLGSFEKDQVVGSIELSDQGDELMGIGLVILHKALRGMGFGSAMFKWGKEKALELKPKASLLLTATSDGAKVYEQFGFSALALNTDLIREFSKSDKLPDATIVSSGHSVVSIDLLSTSSSTLWKQATELADSATSASRSGILDAMLRSQCFEANEAGKKPTVTALGLVDDSTSKLVGWAALHPAQGLSFLGPLVAPSIDVAQALVSHLIRDAVSEASGNVKVFAGVDGRVDSKDEFREWLQSYMHFKVLNNFLVMGCPANGVDMKKVPPGAKQWVFVEGAHM